MSAIAPQPLLWRNVTLFDGLQAWPTPMAVRVEGERITGLVTA